MSNLIIPTPFAAHGMLYITSGYIGDKERPAYVIRPGARGDITGTDNVAWLRRRGTPYIPSLLLYGESLYFVYHYQGILTRIDAKTGEERPGGFRIPPITDVYASPVGAAGRVYITDRDGTTIVIAHADDHQVLAVNELDDSFSASAAIAGREFYLRGESWLYCIAEP